MIDFLPADGDHTIAHDEKGKYYKRGSQFVAQITASIESVTDSKVLENFDIEYTTDAQKPTIEENIVAHWVPASAISDWSQVKGFKVHLKSGKQMAPKSEANLYVPVKMPFDKSILDQHKVAVNTVALFLRGAGSDTEPIAKGETGESGEITFPNIPYGDYEVRQLVGPSRYVKIDDSVPVEAHFSSENNTVTVPLVNPMPPITITVTKSGNDPTGSVNLPNAKLGLFKTETGGEPVKTAITDKDGVATFADVEVDDYYLGEIEAPTGYALATGTVNVSSDQFSTTDTAILAGTISDQKLVGSLEVTKTDAETGTAREGGTFGLYPKGSTPDTPPIAVGTGTSDGKVTFPDVPYGDYEMRQIKPPVGTNPADNTVPVTAHFGSPGDKVDLGNFSNTRIRGNVEIRKVTSQGLHPMPGVKLALCDGEGNFLSDPVMTDNRGVVRFENVLYGSYFICEAKTPFGYYPSRVKIPFQIETQGNTVVLANWPSKPISSRPPVQGQPIVPVLPGKPAKPAKPGQPAVPGVKPVPGTSSKPGLGVSVKPKHDSSLASTGLDGTLGVFGLGFVFTGLLLMLRRKRQK